MKLAVFGATRRTGKPLVEQALKEGHQVTVLVRDPAKIQIEHPGLTVIKVDATDAEAVAQVIKDQEGVITVLGHTKGAPADLLTVSATNITSAMSKYKVKRLVALTGAGVNDPNDQPKLIDQVIRAIFKLPVGGMKEILQDSTGYVEKIKATELDWVIVRGPRLTEEAARGNYRVGYVGKDSGIKVGRADLAEFMLKQLTENRYLHTMPVVSY